MIILRIFLQIAIGIAALLTVYLDYNWYDKRKKEFKKGRNWLIFFMIIILVSSIIITWRDENKQEKEKEKLAAKLEDMKDSLSIIKQIGIELNNQIEPFLILARKKYPDLPTGDALRKLESEIVDLKAITKKLKLKEQNRKIQEVEFSKLKKTPPDVKFELDLIDSSLVILIKFNNNVPITMSPWLYNFGPWECEDHTKKYDIFRIAHPNPIEFYPPSNKNKKIQFIFDTIEKGEELPNNKLLCMRMLIKYSSVYADEIHTPELIEKKVSVDYVIEPYSMKFIPTKFKE